MVSAETLKGKKVIGVRGSLIGEVEGIEISMDDWKVSHFHVQLSDEVAKQLGFKTGLISVRTKPIISLPVEAIDHVGDVVTVKNEIKELKDLEHAEMRVSGPPPV
ncbi:MAG: hypothetical protein NWE93_02565 [Candidatus Bathyarchaeota archaeon]|nr:hypothetical protein [Candidatus Bathyarchaeota archaeon]